MQHYHPDPDHTPDGHHVEPEEGPLEDNPLWQRDNVTLSSVGIDIGSAGTQILFSRMHLRRQAVDLSSRYLVVARETLYESPVALTPYESDTMIDARALGEIVDEAYHQANLHPDLIDTGVVILTGEALRRRNAERIASVLSEKCGDLVCATAGHHMEATLAAYGSGAVQISHDRQQKLLNIDIGGGTTKLSVIDNGKILSTAAIHIGGRLLAVDSGGKLERLEPAGRAHAQRAGFTWQRGDAVTDNELRRVAESMADDLVKALTAHPPEPAVMDLYLTDPISHLEDIEAIIFSGGVSEFVYGRESRDFGDLGHMLGRAIRDSVESRKLPWSVLAESHGIRSTALGCSEFTAQLSGNTGYISDADALLPKRNVNVIRPHFEFVDNFDAEELADAIRRHMVMFDLVRTDTDIVLAFHWDGSPQYKRIKATAEGIRLALADRIARGLPIYIVLDSDIALNLGAILHEELGVGTEVMVIDGVALWDFDSIDLGRLRMPSKTVPVTIKSLVFGDMSGNSRPSERIGSVSGIAVRGRAG